MNESELLKILYSEGNNGLLGTSLFDQYRNAADNKTALGSMLNKGDITTEQYNKHMGQMKASQGAAIAGGAVSGLSALGQIVNGSNELSRTADAGVVNSEIDDVYNIGNRQYGNFDDITQGYLDLSYLNPDVDYMKIRGKSDGQRAAGVGSNIVSGASAGAQIGGLPGAAVGAAVGLGAGIAGIVTGNRDAHDEKRFLDNKLRWSKDNAQMNLSTAHDTVQENQHRNNLTNVRAFGGRIKLRHYKGNGGTVVRLKRK